MKNPALLGILWQIFCIIALMTLSLLLYKYLKRHKNKNLLLFLLSCSFLQISCNKDIHYDRQKSLPFIIK